MKFLADENFEPRFVERLRREGYEVLYINEIALGANDEEVLHYANKWEAILLTHDKDFGELYFRQGLISKGVVLLRLNELSLNEKIERAVKAMKQHKAELVNAFTVVTANSIRIRKNT